MVLEFREQDLVTAVESEREDVGHEVDALGAAADEDDLVGAGRAEEVGHRAAGGLVGVGGPGGERVGAAMDVGVVVGVEMGEGVDHNLRLLRGGGVVEPGQRLAVDTLGEDREVAADGFHVETPGEGPAGQGCRLRPRTADAQRRRVEEWRWPQVIEPPDAVDERADARHIGGRCGRSRLDMPVGPADATRLPLPLGEGWGEGAGNPRCCDGTLTRPAAGLSQRERREQGAGLDRRGGQVRPERPGLRHARHPGLARGDGFGEQIAGGAGDLVGGVHQMPSPWTRAVRPSDR